MSFQQGLSGLNVASKSLDVIGNNIANSGVAGFKGASAQFGDVFASAIGGGGAGAGAVGIGAQLQAVAQQFSQGNITSTNNPMDLAINGGGFFRMSDAGNISYSRNGQFHVDKSGGIINTTGQALTGYSADAAGNILATAASPIMIPTGALAPNDTGAFNVVMNLNSASTVKALASFDTTNPSTFNNSTSGTVFDSIGGSHTMTLYFLKTAANAWSTYVQVDGASAAPVLPADGIKAPTGVTFTPGATLSSGLAFSTGGALTTPMPLTVSVNLNTVAAAQVPPVTNSAATPLVFTLDFTSSTQYGNPFSVTTLSQDGYASGTLSSIGIGGDGIMVGHYSNGQTKNLGQVVLANFANPNGLTSVGSNQWTDNTESGLPIIGVPGTGALGALQASAIEDSNVDLTAELVNMITAQRIYQANAQSIKTQDSVLQTLVNLR
jgi:flagellar hook protein FlgE